MMEFTPEQELEHYRWLKQVRTLDLTSDNSLWKKADGTPFINSHYLAANGTKFSPGESLDEIIHNAILDEVAYKNHLVGIDKEDSK